jgi:hypothetical protein
MVRRILSFGERGRTTWTVLPFWCRREWTEDNYSASPIKADVGQVMMGRGGPIATTVAFADRPHFHSGIFFSRAKVLGVSNVIVS